MRVGDITSGRRIDGERSVDVRRLMEAGHARHPPVAGRGPGVRLWWPQGCALPGRG